MGARKKTCHKRDQQMGTYTDYIVGSNF